MPDGVTQRILDRWVARSPHGGGCTLPGGGCASQRGMHLFQTCHPARGFRVYALASGTLLLQCGGCPAVLLRIAVTDVQESGPVSAPCHARSRLRVGYLVGGLLMIDCACCLATVQRLTVAGGSIVPPPMTMHYIDASCPLRDWPRTRSGSQPEGVSALVRRLLTAEQRRRTPRAPVKSRAARTPVFARPPPLHHLGYSELTPCSRNARL